MPPSPGTRIGPYEVVAQIGAGGMGEVYRARDTKLDRDVAIKVLPEVVAADAERIARFEREAKTLAALNHPGIAAIYGFEDSGEAKALVMELVEGPTLADRLAGGALPVAEAVRIAIQIAEALEAAHRQGIIHRDLKPANVKVRRDGTVKILDFGLAKAMETASTPGGVAGQAHSMSPTITTPAMTQAGIILGTAAYMSPEQAQGLDVDERTDIWAFGCVLYEMLTGRTLFAGDNVSLTLARILERTPDFGALPAGLHPRLRDLVERCLEKDARGRWHHMGDVRVELQKAQADPTGGRLARPERLAPSGLPWLAFAVVAVVAVALAGLAVVTLQPAPETTRLHVAVPLAPGQRLAGLEQMSPVALSPDGRTVAYVAAEGGVAQLFVRTLDDPEVTPLPGTEGAEGPFFSPDGQSIGFFAGAELKTVSLLGGVPVPVARSDRSRGGSWGRDGFIYFTINAGAGIARVPVEGGDPETVTSPDRGRGEGLQRFPQALPDGKTLLFTMGTGGRWDDARIMAMDLETGVQERLYEGGSDARYVSTGHLVFMRDGALMALPFDLDRLEVTGEPVVMIEGVMQTTEVTGALFAGVSDLGDLVYVPGTFLPRERRVVWVDRQGAPDPLPIPERSYMRMDLSPDGRRAALEVDDGNQQQLYIWDDARPTLLEPLTREGANNQAPAFMSDGERVSFISLPGDGTSGTVRWMSADGGGPAEEVVATPFVSFFMSFSPDGRFLALESRSPDEDYDILYVGLNGDSEFRAFLDSPEYEGYPRFSPDSRFLAYSSDESGQDEIYIRSFPDGEERRQVSIGGSSRYGSAWSRDGSDEFYYLGGEHLMVVDVEAEPRLTVREPRELFKLPFPVAQTFGVTPDGERFLMIQIGNETDGSHIGLVLNFGEELRRLLPAD